MKRSFLKRGAWLISIGLSAMTAQAATVTALATGVVVDAERGQAYYAAAGGQLRAVRLSDGAAAWATAQIAWPLALVDGQLLVLQKPRRPGELRLQLVDADAGDSGRVLTASLPDAVHADATVQPQRRFTIRAVPATSPGAVRLAWRYQERPLQGALPELDEAARDVGEGVREEGWMQLDLADGQAQELPGTAPQPDPLVPADGRAASAGPAPQYRAADAAHVQSSTAHSHPQLGTEWQWHLHAAGGGARAGEVSLPVAYAPFQVLDQQLLVQLPAYAWRAGTSRFELRNVRLAAFDLSSGAERWSVDLADPDYKGAMPP